MITALNYMIATQVPGEERMVLHPMLVICGPLALVTPCIFAVCLFYIEVSGSVEQG